MHPARRDIRFHSLFQDDKTNCCTMATMAYVDLSVCFCILDFISALVSTYQRKTEIIDKPLIIFAQDNSLSIVLSKDSAFYRNDYPDLVRKLQENLGKTYDVSMLSFGDRIAPELKTSFSEKITDISSVMEEVNTRYSNRNIGALIIATDGIFNRGSNPFYAAQRSGSGLYCRTG